MSRSTLLSLAALAPLVAACGTTPASLDRPNDALDAAADASASDTRANDARANDTLETVDASTAPEVSVRSVDLDCDEPGTHWTAPRFERWLEPAWLGFSPNEQLAVMHMHAGFGSTAWRLSDGFVASGGGVTPVAVSPDWSVVAKPGEDAVLDVFVDNELAQSASPPWLIPGWQTAAVSDDARRIAMATCDDEQHLLGVLDLERGELQWHTFEALPNECYSYPRRPLLAWEPGSAAVFFAPVGSGRLARHDVDAATTLWIDAHPEIDSIEGQPPLADVYALAVHPEGTEVATTGTGNQLRRWRLPDLEPIGDAIEIGAETLNEMTYAPWWVASPVAYSPNGGFLAHVEPDLDLVVRSLETLDVVATIALADFPIPDDEFMPDDNAIAMLAFTPDGQDLLVVAQHGAILWGCGDHAAPIDIGELDVSGGGWARVSGTAHFRVTLPARLEHAIVRVTVNGGEAGFDISGADFSYHLSQAGAMTFEFVATDGVYEARKTVVVEVAG